jgi:outer membrane protein TolC
MEASELIALSKKVVDFRREDFKIQRDRHDAGLNLESDFLTAKAALIKSESDLLAAQLNYRMAVTDLQMLTFSDIF